MDTNDSYSLDHKMCYHVEFDDATTRMYETCIWRNEINKTIIFYAIISFNITKYATNYGFIVDNSMYWHQKEIVNGLIYKANIDLIRCFIYYVSVYNSHNIFFLFKNI